MEYSASRNGTGQRTGSKSKSIFDESDSDDDDLGIRSFYNSTTGGPFSAAKFSPAATARRQNERQFAFSTQTLLGANSTAAKSKFGKNKVDPLADNASVGGRFETF